MYWFEWVGAVLLTALVGTFCAMIWVGIAKTHCDDGFVYFDNNNYRGCVPLDFAKEHA